MRTNMQYSAALSLYLISAFSIAAELPAPRNSPAGQTQAELLVSGIGIEVSRLLGMLAGGESDASLRTPMEPHRRSIAGVIESRPATMAVIEQNTLLKGQREEVFAGFLPQVSVTAGSGKRQYDLGSGVSRTSVDGESQQKSVTVKQLLWDFWATRRSYEATGKRIDGVQYQLQSQKSEVVLNALAAIHEVERGYLLQDLARANLASHIALADLIRQRESLGASSKAEVIRAEARIPGALDEQATAMRKLSVAQASYREIFGREAARSGLPAELAMSVVAPESVENVLLKHPLVMQAVMARDAAADERAALRGRNIGTLTLDLNVGDRRDLAIDSTPRRDNSVFLNFSSALYTGGAASAREDQAASRVRLATIDLDRVRQETERKLRQAIGEYSGQVEIVQARLKSVQSAEQAFAVTKELYVSKRGSLLDVFNAQQELATAARGLVDSLIDRAIAKYTLMHAADTLRGWLEKSL